MEISESNSKTQMITYLKLSGYRIGLLLNFYVLKLVNVLFRLKY
ncbi:MULTISPECIES: GxxExxY protein [unclassified Algoriphagus]|nr:MULTISPECIES: GxxExxY protein [unclassified Algoriphagus]